MVQTCVHLAIKEIGKLLQSICCLADYSQMPIGKVWIYQLLFVCLVFCVSLFVWLWISLLWIKLAVSKFARQFFSVQGRESPIFVNFVPPEAQNRMNRPARRQHTPLQYIAQSTIGMCGYRLFPTDLLINVSVSSHVLHLL